MFTDPENLSGRWSSQNKDSVGQLLFQMFSYYAVEHDVERHVVSVTQKKPYLRSNTKWNAKRIAVIGNVVLKLLLKKFGLPLKLPAEEDWLCD